MDNFQSQVVSDTDSGDTRATDDMEVTEPLSQGTPPKSVPTSVASTEKSQMHNLNAMQSDMLQQVDDTDEKLIELAAQFEAAEEAMKKVDILLEKMEANANKIRSLLKELVE